MEFEMYQDGKPVSVLWSAIQMGTDRKNRKVKEVEELPSCTLELPEGDSYSPNEDEEGKRRR